jgi:hypothetical protein
MRAQCADLQRLDGKVEIVDRAGRGCEMQHRINRAFDIDVVCDILLDKVEIIAPGQMLDIARAAGDEVIHGDDRMAFGQEFVAQMRA